MNTLALNQPSHSSAFLAPLSLETLRERAPAAFADSAHESRSCAYTFISTATVVDALQVAGFYPVEARQALRARSALHARHLIRFRRRFETVALRDAVPEILFLNSHDGTSAYQLRVGLYRAVCTNGLVVSQGRAAARRASSADIGLPGETAYREAVSDLNGALEGSNVEAARAALRSLVGNIPVFQSGRQLAARLTMNPSALLRNPGNVLLVGSGGRI
jgi:hypothetical protein